jgi:hypothetical protein
VPLNHASRVVLSKPISNVRINTVDKSPTRLRASKSNNDRTEENIDLESNKYSDISNDLCVGAEVTNDNYLLEILEKDESSESASKLDRKRSSSFSGIAFPRDHTDCLVLKSGLLKKKGIIFYNNRMVSVNARGILTYYDPKNMSQPRGMIDLSSQSTIVKLNGGKLKYHIEIIAQDQSYIFKVRTVVKTLMLYAINDTFLAFNQTNF